MSGTSDPQRVTPAASEYRFWTEEKLRNADTDRQGHVNNAVFGTFFEAGRIEVLERPEIAAAREGRGIVVARQTIHYRKELFFPGSVKIGTRVRRIGRTSFEFEQVLLAVNGEVAHGESVCVLMDRATRSPVPVPDAMRIFLIGS
jgi:acyl-CoA thioester hydrolase